MRERGGGGGQGAMGKRNRRDRCGGNSEAWEEENKA